MEIHQIVILVYKCSRQVYYTIKINLVTVCMLEDVLNELCVYLLFGIEVLWSSVAAIKVEVGHESKSELVQYYR